MSKKPDSSSVPRAHALKALQTEGLPAPSSSHVSDDI